MKGDFSRIRFEPNKHFTDVLNQQGRVAFDSDHNEQRFIDARRRTLESIDVIGEFGAPMHEAGFEISFTGTGLSIGAGRYYVHGLPCENAAALDYGDQPFLIEHDEAVDIRVLLAELRRARDACLCVYLEVWQRMLTSLDDACLGEPALGQADTTVRLQTVWRVLARPFTPAKQRMSMQRAVDQNVRNEASALAVQRECSCDAMYDVTPPEHTGRLSARVAESGDECGCQPIPAAGYTGQENQLYRIEIQRSGALGTATLKWSRENGSIVVAVLHVSGNKVSVNSLGMDANLGFQEGQWVELSDDTDLFGETPDLPGRLYQIRHIERASMVLTMTTTVQPVDCSRNARMRRWDQAGNNATADGVLLSADWIALENGIQVRFAKGEYFAGDAWTIPARSATGQIEWPPCGSDANPFQPPHYAHVYRAPLACIHFNSPDAARATKAQTGAAYHSFIVDDCRRLFPPLTELGRCVGASALLIERINWRNDDVITFDALVRQGLQVTLNKPPTCPLSGANFIVTLEVPFAVPGREFMMSRPAAEATSASSSPFAVGRSAFGPTILRTALILDSLVEQRENTVLWTLPYEHVGSGQLAELSYINQILNQWARLGVPTRARVRLPGHALYAVTEAGARLYLDGQAFGRTVTDDTSKTPRIDLALASGDSERASDFESWFYLYPALGVESVNLTYSSLVVRDNGEAASIVAADPSSDTKQRVQQASIALNYPAPRATTLQLTLAGDSAVASVPATVAVAQGESRVTVDVSIDAAPAGATASSFTLTASLPSALDRTTSHTASFTVTGERLGMIDKASPQEPIRTRKTSGQTGAETKTPSPSPAPAPADKPLAKTRTAPKRKRS